MVSITCADEPLGTNSRSLGKTGRESQEEYELVMVLNRRHSVHRATTRSLSTPPASVSSTF